MTIDSPLELFGILVLAGIALRLGWLAGNFCMIAYCWLLNWVNRFLTNLMEAKK